MYRADCTSISFRDKGETQINVMCVEVLHVLKNVWFDEEILFSEKVEIQSDTINSIRTKIDRFPEDFERTLGNSSANRYTY